MSLHWTQLEECRDYKEDTVRSPCWGTLDALSVARIVSPVLPPQRSSSIPTNPPTRMAHPTIARPAASQPRRAFSPGCHHRVNLPRSSNPIDIGSKIVGASPNSPFPLPCSETEGAPHRGPPRPPALRASTPHHRVAGAASAVDARGPTQRPGPLAPLPLPFPSPPSPPLPAQPPAVGGLPSGPHCKPETRGPLELPRS